MREQMITYDARPHGKTLKLMFAIEQAISTGMISMVKTMKGDAAVVPWAEFESLRAKNQELGQKAAALAVRVGELKEALESITCFGHKACPKGKCPVERAEKALSRPDNAEEVLREHDVEKKSEGAYEIMEYLRKECAATSTQSVGFNYMYRLFMRAGEVARQMKIKAVAARGRKDA